MVTANLGMTYANAGLGFNLYAFKGSLKNLRLGFEAALPLFQKHEWCTAKNQRNNYGRVAICSINEFLNF